MLLAVGGGGFAFGPHLAAYPDHEQRRIAVFSNSQGGPVATITPTFTVPDRLDLDPDRTAWTPGLDDGTALASTDTWRDAARAVADALEQQGRRGS